MEASRNDVIAAVASPPGQGAVALVRVSGAEAAEVVSAALADPGWPDNVAPRTQRLATVRGSDGTPVDTALVTWFPAPASYTGDPVAEIACHGGTLVTRRVLGRLIECGARPAEPGEFTQRAFLNGKLDLTQAEAVMDVISAQTDLALRSANEQLAGRLGEALASARAQLLAALAHLEAYIDFPDEDIDPATGEQLAAQIAAVRDDLGALLATADQGRLLREGVRTVLCGAPNVGKSSLLNVLLGFDRAIVSESAGTTRDTIEEVINLHGFPVRLVDTAGIRHGADDIEREGIARSHRQLANADLVIEILDASAGADQPRVDRSTAGAANWVTVLNKADLPEHPDWRAAPAAGESVRVSCTARTGTDALADALADAITSSASDGGGAGAIAINARHQHCLQRAAGHLDTALDGVRSNALTELVAVDLRSALAAIGETVGQVDTEELLGEIFGSFCIGK